MMMKLIALIALWALTLFAHADNLSTCLSGKYPSLCNNSQLSAAQRQQVIVAERSENLKTCITGKYPILCRKNLLTPSEIDAVHTAELRENLKTCITGKYPILCKHSLLTSVERLKVADVEQRENTATCMTGRYAALCKKGLLTSDQKTLAEVAEKKFQQASPPRRATSIKAGGSGCEAGHWVDAVMSNGEYVKLEDGSIWKIDIIDQVDTMLWLPTTDIIASSGKLINTEDNETAGAVQMR
jgi:hypothetical protein